MPNKKMGKGKKLKSKYMKQIHKYAIIAGIAFIALIVLISIYGLPKTEAQLEEERKQECLSNNGIFYEGKCLSLDEIEEWKEYCESENKTAVFLRYEWGGESKCYREIFTDKEVSNSTQEQVVSCGNLGGIPVVTDKVLCVDMNTSSDSSGLEYIEDFSEE